MNINSSILGLCLPSEDVQVDIRVFEVVAALYSGDGPSSVSLPRGDRAGMHLERLLDEHEATGPEITPVPDDSQDEDGESLQHEICHLKALMVAPRHAQSGQFSVMHGHSHPLNGTDA